MRSMPLAAGRARGLGSPIEASVCDGADLVSFLSFPSFPLTTLTNQRPAAVGLYAARDRTRASFGDCSPKVLVSKVLV